MAASEASSVALASSSARLRLKKFFFPSMALLMIATVFLGFARTFFLAPVYHYHLPNLLVAVHGTVFASWIALFAVQASLVPAGRLDLHKKLGVFGAVLAGLMIVMGCVVMLEGLHRPFTTSSQDEAQILALDVVGLVASLGFFTAGLLLRRNPAAHKRLMFFGTIPMLGPAIARWPFAFVTTRPALVGLLLHFFSLATIIFDLLTMRRVYRATWVGVATLFLVPAIAIPLSAMPSWHHLLDSLTQLLARF